VSNREQRAATILQQASPAATVDERRAVESWLAALQRANDFERVELFDAQRRAVAGFGSSDDDLRRSLEEQLRALPAADTVIVADLHRSGGTTRMVLWTPLARDPGRDASPGAWVALVVDADRKLFPQLRGAPVSYRTGEFVLWRADGDSLRMMSEVRFEDNRGIRRSIGRDDPSSNAARSVRVGPVSFRAPDYRGVLTRGTVLPIAGTRWLLVAKVDDAEIREPIFRAGLRTTIITLFFLLSVAAISYALWYRRDLTRTERELALLADRQRGVAELQRSEARYARAVRGTADGLWDWDFTTSEIFVSPRWRDVVGVPATSDVRGAADFLSYFEPRDVARHEAALARHLEHGEPYDLEMQLRPAPGAESRWIRTRGEVERDATGRAVRMGGAITDITRGRLAELSLQRSERVLRMRTAVNRALVGATDEAELYQTICEIAVSDGGYRMSWIGLKEQTEARAVTPVAIAGDERGYLRENPITWSDDERGQGPTGRCIRFGTPQVAQNLLTDPHFAPWREAAQARGFQSMLAIPLNVQSEVIGAFMLYAEESNAFDAEELALSTELGRDISFGVSTLRDRATLDAQREELMLFRQAIDRSSDAIFVADVASGRFVDFNDAALRQLGYTDAEMRRIGPADVVVDMDARGGIASVTDAVHAAGSLLRPSIHKRKDGTEVPVEVALSMLELGQRSLILCIARDISERVELQAQLTRAQRMESVGRLAGGIAHDFNNLLTVITTSADLVLGELAAESPMRRDLTEIRSAGERAARLTRQLLAFSRQQVFKREVLDLNDVVTKFQAMLSRVIGEDIKVELHLAPTVPRVLADAGQLDQVLMNLCVNARDAMPLGGRLTISTGSTEVDQEHAAHREGMSAGPYATLAVSDTGSGMDKETQAMIFDPFFTTKEPGRGTGLGLSTVYGIVKQSGGSIWCYSELGLGTTFRIYLPVTTELAGEHSSGPTRSLHGGKETVLVVEDEPSIRFVARRVLERSGYTVLEADSGVAALELLANYSGPLDLVLTDLVMPGMTGIELAETLRTTRPTLKLLFTSGYSADVVADRFTPTADWNFISKPYGVRELANEVRRVLDS
jgi:PAS domain S-box-containing protein